MGIVKATEMWALGPHCKKHLLAGCVVLSTAKYYENHVIITTENNEHIRGSLMLIADTQ